MIGATALQVPSARTATSARALSSCRRATIRAASACGQIQLISSVCVIPRHEYARKNPFHGPPDRETACPGAPNHSTHSTALPVDLTANPQLFGAVLVFRRLGLRHMLNG